MFCLLCKQALGNLLAETLFQTAEVGLGWLPMQSWPKTAQATARQSRLFRACATHLLSYAQNTLAPRKITRPVLGVRASFARPWPCVCTPTPKHVGTHVGPPGHTYTPPRTLAWVQAICVCAYVAQRRESLCKRAKSAKNVTKLLPKKGNL